ncbi:MAG: hypothetical protein IJR57_00055 [Ruminococcus sp.]|nr:hypothetical protein [Ruminococcus sp.]
MSLFLGSIHYWLYGKISNQEELTKRIAAYAQQENLIDSSTEYVRELSPLEEVIDEGNIHGWLQAYIADAEMRYADLVTQILANDEDCMDALQQIAYRFGEKHALDGNIDAQGSYEAFENFFPSGMPCDRVNAVTAQDESSISWEQTRDIHAVHWTENAEPYYLLKKSVMDGMLSKTDLELKMPDINHYTINKK